MIGLGLALYAADNSPKMVGLWWPIRKIPGGSREDRYLKAWRAVSAMQGL